MACFLYGLTYVQKYQVRSMDFLVNGPVSWPTFLFWMLTWSKCEWMSFIWIRLIESAASSSPSTMLAPTLSGVKGNQSINQSGQNLAFRQRKTREKYVQTNIAALSLPPVLTTTILCTIPDNTFHGSTNKHRHRRNVTSYHPFSLGDWYLFVKPGMVIWSIWSEGEKGILGVEVLGSEPRE